jgi:hypothetical protein
MNSWRSGKKDCQEFIDIDVKLRSHTWSQDVLDGNKMKTVLLHSQVSLFLFLSHLTLRQILIFILEARKLTRTCLGYSRTRSQHDIKFRNTKQAWQREQSWFFVYRHWVSSASRQVNFNTQSTSAQHSPQQNNYHQLKSETHHQQVRALWTSQYLNSADFNYSGILNIRRLSLPLPRHNNQKHAKAQIQPSKYSEKAPQSPQARTQVRWEMG